MVSAGSPQRLAGLLNPKSANAARFESNALFADESYPVPFRRTAAQDTIAHDHDALIAALDAVKR